MSMLAASSGALSLVTSTPFLISSKEPSAMLTVNMAGRATGMAPSSRASIKGSRSSRSAPFQTDNASATANIMATIASNRFETLEMTSSMCNFGVAICTSCAVLPKYVFAPVRTTTPVASPRLATEPE